MQSSFGNVTSIRIVRFGPEDRYPVSAIKADTPEAPGVTYVVMGVEVIGQRHHWSVKPWSNTDSESGRSLLLNKIAIAGHENIEYFNDPKTVYFERLANGEIFIVCDLPTA